MKNQTTKKLNLAIAISCVVAVVILASVFTCFAVPALTDKSYAGIYIGDVYVGGMDESAIEKKLTEEYGKYEINPRFSHEGNEFQIYGSQVDLKADFKQSAKNVVAYGKEGNLLSKINNMRKLKKSSVGLDVVVTCDINLLQYSIGENFDDEFVGVEQYKVEYGENCLIVTNGKKGRGVNSEKVIDAISANYTKKVSDQVISITIEDILPDPIDPETFCELYNRDPKDAECLSDGEIIEIVPEVVGVKFDEAEATRIINENKNNPESYTIPALLTYPSVTAANLEAEFTDCIIGTYKTNYSTSTANRKENIRLASEKINGKILNPGEIFSFNDVVGPRTAENGYKTAHVYVGNKTVEGLGGGICQVSSTLYNAVVFADLEIVYRTNHSMPVSYVPLGRDATVSYGTIDFKIKNNKETPVKFEVIADGTELTVNVYGRKKYVKDITIENVVTGSVPFSVVVEKDPTMYEDEHIIAQRGSYGTNVETYKIVKENGEIVSKTFLAKSSYTPTTQIEKVGTLKREKTPSDEENSDEENSDEENSDEENSDENDSTTQTPSDDSSEPADFPEESETPPSSEYDLSEPSDVPVDSPTPQIPGDEPSIPTDVTSSPEVPTDFNTSETNISDAPPSEVNSNEA